MRYKFDQYCLDLDRHELKRARTHVEVEPQVFNLLAYLIRNRERVVPWGELIESVWDGRFISDSTLSSRVSVLRKAIGDTGKEQRLIRTTSRSGLRFVGEVEEDHGAEASQGGDNALDRLLGSSPELPDKPSIAVLPFKNLSDDREQDYFSDGITEDIITALSRIRGFFMIARSTSFAYKAKPFKIEEIHRELGVRYVLEGSVRRSGDRLRVSAELVDAVSGVQLWGERYDRELTDVFAMQDDITRSVAAAIEPRLLIIEGTRTLSRRSEELGAWELLTRAMASYGRMTVNDSKTTIAILEDCIKKYPDYGPAHSMLAFALLVSVHVGWIPESTSSRYASELAHRAARLDADDPWAFLALGYLAFTERQTEEAVRQITRALELNPNFATAYRYLGWALVFDGQSDAALPYFEQSLRMSPQDPLRAFSLSGTGVAHYFAERHELAAEWARMAVRERPEFAAAHRILCACLAQAGKAEETKQAVRNLREVQPNVSIAWIERFVPYTPRAMPYFLEGMRKAGLADYVSGDGSSTER